MLSTACQRLWRWVCGFPKRVLAGTHHVDLHEIVPVKERDFKKKVRLPTWHKCVYACAKQEENVTKKLAPMRRDPVPEMVWTVMFCQENRGSVYLALKMCTVSCLSHHSTYPATLQDLIISTKSQLGAGLGKVPQTTDAKVLLVQLFGCNDGLCLQVGKSTKG